MAQSGIVRNAFPEPKVSKFRHSSYPTFSYVCDEIFFSQKKYHTKKLLDSLIAYHTEIVIQTRELLPIQLFFFEARFEAAARGTGHFPLSENLSAAMSYKMRLCYWIVFPRIRSLKVCRLILTIR